MAYMEHVNYGDILDSTIGIVFMGTPHRGSDLASWGLILTSLVNTATLGTGINKELLKTLKADSDMLAGISRQFVHRATCLKIRTFTEQQVERPLTTLVSKTRERGIHLSDLIKWKHERKPGCSRELCHHWPAQRDCAASKCEPSQHVPIRIF